MIYDSKVQADIYHTLKWLLTIKVQFEIVAQIDNFRSDIDIFVGIRTLTVNFPKQMPYGYLMWESTSMCALLLRNRRFKADLSLLWTRPV